MQPEADWLFSRFRVWGLRAFGLMFLTFGILAVAYAVRHNDAARIAAKSVAAIVGAVAVVMSAISYRYGLQSRRVRRGRLRT